jgi:hypothetical protein
MTLALWAKPDSWQARRIVLAWRLGGKGVSIVLRIFAWSARESGLGGGGPSWRCGESRKGIDEGKYEAANIPSANGCGGADLACLERKCEWNNPRGWVVSGCSGDEG